MDNAPVEDGAAVPGCECESLYNCCDCGGNECGCRYCFSCNACERCLSEDGCPVVKLA